MSAALIEVHASEIHSSRTCLRKWHGVYVQGLREPDTAGGAMARGTAIHAILEDYLDGKGPIDTTTEYGRIAASGLKFLPQPGTVHTELDFSFPADGWIYAGTIDMIRPYYVGDHKTTSNFKYQKDQATLIEDPQAILYGTRAQLDGKSDIECQWIYYRTSGANKAQETRFIYPGSLLQENKQKLDEEVKAILGRRKLRLLDIEPTPTACFKYGKPCHLRSQCVDLRPSIGNLMSLSKDQLLADLKAKALGIANPAGVAMPPPAATVAPPTAGGPPALPSLPGLPGATPAAAVTAPAPGLPSLPALPGAAPVAAVTAPVTTGLPSLPALPGAAPVAAPAAPSGPPSLPPPVIDPAVAAAIKAEADAKAAAKAAKAGPPALPPMTQPSLPGLQSPAAQVTAAVMGNGPDFAAAAVGTGAAPAKPIDTLYVDCLPVGEPYTPFSQVAELCHSGIRDTVGLIHYRMAQYGTGPAMWCEAVRMFVGASPIKALVLDTDAGDAKDALEALLTMANRVVRGIK